MSKETKKQKIVIVGGGFGGVRAAHNLNGDKRFDVTLISNRPHFEYHAGLYRTVTGRSPMENVVPLENMFEDSTNVAVELETITKIDPKNSSITAESGNVFTYDKLILATGNITNYFNIEGLKEYSYGMKSASDALELRERLHDVIIKAHEGEPTQFVVVGGGATGIELSSELCFYLKKLCRQHGVDTSQIKIDLVEAAERILPLMSNRFSRRVTRRLKRLGVKVHVKSMVEGESADSLKFAGETIKTDVVVWTAGVANNPLLLEYDKIFEFDKRKRVKVTRHLEAAKNIHVIGDNAATKYTGMAQTALYDADFVSKNLKRTAGNKKIKRYKPKRPIYVMPAGSHWAAVQWGKVSLFGYKGWIIRRVADLRLLLDFMPLLAAFRKWRRGNAPIKNPCPLCSMSARLAESE